MTRKYQRKPEPLAEINPIIATQNAEIARITADNARLVESRDGYIRQLNEARAKIDGYKKDIEGLRYMERVMIRLEGYQERVREMDAHDITLQHGRSND